MVVLEEINIVRKDGLTQNLCKETSRTTLYFYSFLFVLFLFEVWGIIFLFVLVICV